MRKPRLGHRARTSAVAVLAVAGVALTLAASGTARPAGPGPQLLAEPSISGAATVGERLTANRGLWSGAGPIAYKYQWLRCNPDVVSDSSPASCKNILGATRTSYVLGTPDRNTRLRVRIKASNNQGANEATSAPTSVVQNPGGVPASEAPPSIAGSPFVGSTLRASPGVWVGSQPMTFSYRWLRCDKNGNACNAISGANNVTYKLVTKDAGKTLRLRVIAKNRRGMGDAFSAPTDVVIDAGGGDGIITLPDGSKSVDVAKIPNGQRLIVDQVKFSPNPVTSLQQTIVSQIRVKDSRGYVVRGAIVFIRSTPRVTSGGDNLPTGIDGWVTYQLVPRANFPIANGNVQFFVKAYRKGDPTLGGISASRLVQVGTRKP